ncbi:hypothetical protein [Aestuariivita boseongensis]|uniref:hypothetical protein n=1 Tax=Aestuariivita boseongensis TaxID=1470562 RepID=UPI0006816DDC|nr:hypothetical protein [Aestuariivita boseongensis]
MSVVEQTHEAVWEAVGACPDGLYWNKGSLRFFTAETGLGKTTGFRKTIKRLWDTYWQDMPVLIMVPTRRDADIMFQEMEKIEPGASAVWTQWHDPENTQVPAFTPSAKFSKHEASKRKCLILTHNAGRQAEEWVGRRDLVFVDEYPQPASSDTFEPYHFTKARDDEAKSGPLGDLFRMASDWAEIQEEQGLRPVVVPEWVDKLLAVSPVTEAGRHLQKLAQGIKEGRAFQTKTKTCSWTCFDFDLPFQDRTIIFSATAQFEGWQFGVDYDIGKDGPQVDYSNVVFNWHPWPEGVSTFHRNILSNRDQREVFFEHIRQMVQWADEHTLIISPKDFESDIQHMFEEAHVTHYGCDVGSNEYRDCNRVFLISEFHKPAHVHRANYLAHRGVEKVTEDNLKPVSNTQSSTYAKVRDNNYSVHLKQMVSRGTCRYVNDKGVANAMEVTCMIDKDRFARLVPELFPGAVLIYPEGQEPKINNVRGKRQSTVEKLMIYLPTVPDDQNVVTSVCLKDADIIIKGAQRKKQITEAGDIFVSLGWTFEEGTAGRYGKPAGFVRV